MKEIYIFSGLGADESVFQYIDFSGFNLTYIRWINPVKAETITAYAKRLTEQINSKQPILIGLSFGGMMAIEVSKFINTEKIILISSAKTKYEIPFYFRIAGYLKINKIIPSCILKQSNFLSNWFFGVKSEYEKLQLKQMLKNTHPHFLKWAIDKIACWKNKTIPKNVLHIHGTKDRILPFRYVNVDLKVINGGHLMIFNKADELSKIIREKLID